MTNEPASEIRNRRKLPEAISNEKFRCQEKLFAQKGFNRVNGRTKALVTGKGHKLNKRPAGITDQSHHTVIIY
jgi:hypothetical protein